MRVLAGLVAALVLPVNATAATYVVVIERKRSISDVWQ
ncbi:hypothetical protein AWB72_05550 [Caballeronia concitans]|uniref:Uncharacterized protein n=1 Tax=Caballeronia concitans TaxID=1777133 RepID=A0A658R5F1_9BURK|nr:hypothetical protein AWB72_05550 [Caballeronia concitans]